jgi:hypothetical protein
MTEKSELAVREEPQEKPLEPVASTEDLVRAMHRFEQVKAALLVHDRDSYWADGKERIRKSGWRKLALAFGISDELIDERCERDPSDPSHIVWHVHVRCYTRGGRAVEGVGSASSRERPFAHVEHDLHALAHTRAKSRAIADMLGSSDLVAEETEEPDLPTPPPTTPQPRPTRPPVQPGQQRVDAGQRAILVRFLENVLADDLMDKIRIEEDLEHVRVILPRPYTEDQAERYTKAMWSIGQGLTESAIGLVARLKAPTTPAKP